MPEFDQTNRLLSMTSSLGANKTVLTSLNGRDALSRPFHMDIVFAVDPDIAFSKVKDLLGKGVTLFFGLPEFQNPDDSPSARRPFHGLVRSLVRGRRLSDGGFEWHAELVPEVWFLSRVSDCRIYQDQSIPEIVQDVLKRNNVTFRSKLDDSSYGKLEYCVQYRETSLDFISRLMEQAGIFFWHEHKDGVHTLILSDANGHGRIPAFKDIAVDASNSGSAVRHIEDHLEFRTGKWTLRDYSMLDPSQALEGETETKPKIGVAGMRERERYDYPGTYLGGYHGAESTLPKVSTKEARKMSDLLVAVEEANFHRMKGASDLAGFDAGTRISLDPSPSEEGKQFFLTEVTHRAEDYSHWSADEWGRRERTPPHYTNEFVCIPNSIPFRPERVTPKPGVHGPQTAIITGKSGEEIHTDKYGRVKVKFPWDRSSAKDDTTSCWIRVSQGWAGTKWGQVHLPRVGQEVIVDFLEGDPDRPIVTGRVYNKDNEVPYDLPANKTQSGIKTRSSKGGSSDNFNEIRFEDKKGEEHIYVHAEKDLETVVQNNEKRTVGTDGIGNRDTTIKANETHTIGGDKTTTVSGSFTETIMKTETRTVVGDVTETYAANETRVIGGNVMETVAGSITNITVGGITELVVGAHTELCAAPITRVSAASIVDVAPNLTHTAPNWFKTGAASGDAYGFKMGIAGLKIDTAGISIGIVPVLKFDVAGIKMDNFGIAIKTGALELKNKALKSKTYAFTIKTGFTIVA